MWSPIEWPTFCQNLSVCHFFFFFFKKLNLNFLKYLFYPIAVSGHSPGAGPGTRLHSSLNVGIHCLQRSVLCICTARMEIKDRVLSPTWFFFPVELFLFKFERQSLGVRGFVCLCVCVCVCVCVLLCANENKTKLGCICKHFSVIDCR